MSSIPLPSNMGSAKVDTYQRTDIGGTATVDMQVMVPGNPFAVTTGALTATGSVTVTNLNDACSALVVLSGTFSATMIFEGTVDGTNWFPIQAARADVNSSVTTAGLALAFTAQAFGYKLDLNGVTQVRVRCTAFTSGTVNVAIAPSPHSMESAPFVATISTLTRQSGFTDSSTVLAASATFTGTGRATTGANYVKFNAVAFADQAGTLAIDLSVDSGTTYRQIASVAVAANVAQVLSVPMTGLAGTATLYRVRYVNGATLQAAFQLSSSFTAA
ncbi:MAG: hypothetical protein CGW95_01475 [Phenylobacterium zucineum]|nr:MAG: hypothetical protein CGW95_01475 [Phenylobacterium zucineum]